MISILLASYNGEKYIAEQIDSLLAQTVQDFKLFICDDSSTDSTFSIITQYAAKHPEKIYATQNPVNSGGAKHNFIRMMIEHSADYIMLCDQDDVWLPYKIETTLARMQEMESEFGSGTPLLVHTDLIVVGENLETISPSYKAAMNADYGKTKLHNQIIQNTLTGCTAMYNRALAGLITEAPQFMVMHDWWLMLIASAFGKIAPLDGKTILYRQHGKNDTGAKKVKALSFKIHKLLNYKEIKKALNETYPQAQSLLDIYGSKLTQEQKKLLADYCGIPGHCKPVRWVTICRLGALKNGAARKIANIMFI